MSMSSSDKEWNWQVKRVSCPGHIMYGRKDGLDEMGKDSGMGLLEGA